MRNNINQKIWYSVEKGTDKQCILVNLNQKILKLPIKQQLNLQFKHCTFILWHMFVESVPPILSQIYFAIYCNIIKLSLVENFTFYLSLVKALNLKKKDPKGICEETL